MAADLHKLERLLGYQFQNSALLERALTHRSWAYEKSPCAAEEKIRQMQNESLEFVGDAVLGLAIAEQLFLKHGQASEGDLSLMKHRLVSAKKLSEMAEKIGLGEFVRVGRGEEKTGGRRKLALLADTFEAVLGAIFFDTGYVSARHFVQKVFAEEIHKATPKTSIDYKTLLQETLQADKRPAPTYKVAKSEGPDHKPTFFVEAVWDEGAVSATGSSIKAAEMAAANMVLKQLKKQGKVKNQADRQKEKKEKQARRTADCN